MKRKSGFSLVELLGVTAIIGILMGLVGTAAVSARHRAYTATATSETQQIAAAIKAYWIAYQKWPNISGSSEGGYTLLTKDALKDLIGEGRSKNVFLNIPLDRFEEGEGGNIFADPWGHAYRIKIEPTAEIESDIAFEGVVSFPARFRYYMEDDIFYKDYSHEARVWMP